MWTADWCLGDGAAAHCTTQKERSTLKAADIIVDGVAYYHPYPSNPNASNVWKYLRCKRGVEYSQQRQGVYCMKCCSQQFDGDKTKYIYIYILQQNDILVELFKHVKKRHPVEYQQTTSNPAGFHTSKLSTLVTSKLSKDKCRKFTKKISLWLVHAQDKEPLSFVDRDGSSNFIKRRKSPRMVNTTFDMKVFATD